MDPYRFFKGKYILVTGGAGFIGSHFCESLILGGSHVIVLDNFATGHNILKILNEKNELEKNMASLFSSIIYIQGDILDNDSYTKVDRYLEDNNGAKLSLVIHLAAAISVAESMTNPEKYHRVNVIGSKKVYDYCISHSVPAVISATSAAIYGDCGNVPIDETFPYGGVSPYAKSKYDMEELTRELQCLYSGGSSNGKAKNNLLCTPLKNNLHFINCRFFNVYGPRQDPSSPYTGVMSVFFAKAKAGKPINVYGDGNQFRDFVFVGDVVNGALSLAMDYIQSDSALQSKTENSNLLPSPKVDSSVYNLGTGKVCTINELAAIVLEISNSYSIVKHLSPRIGDIYFSRSNSEAVFKKCSWKAKTSLKDGMKLVWDWFLESSDDFKFNKNEKTCKLSAADITNTFKYIFESTTSC